MGFLALGLVSLLALLLVASLAARLSARHLRLLALSTLFIILVRDLSCWRWPGVMGLRAAGLYHDVVVAPVACTREVTMPEKPSARQVIKPVRNP